MALIDDVKTILDEFSPHGWEDLFNNFGIDISTSNLLEELTVKDIKRPEEEDPNKAIPGFKDFSAFGTKAVTPGNPELSLLFHAFASPNVLWADSNSDIRISKFPTLEQLDTIENFIYASANKTIDGFIDDHRKEDLAIVVFANQYRTAVDTPHKMHADMVYSRTGVARIGNADALYNTEKRGFEPLTENPHEIRTLPAKYDLYIAVKRKGSADILGKRFNLALPQEFEGVPIDENLNFWVPIHKLFNGDECLIGLTLDFSLEASHSNEKIAKIHDYVSTAFSTDTGSNPSDRLSYPYKFGDNIAVFNKEKNLVEPVVHDAVVEKAQKDGTNFTLKKEFKFPVNSSGRPLPLESNNNFLALFSSSLEMRDQTRTILFENSNNRSFHRSVPEYAHIRTEVKNGNADDLNDLPEVEKEIANKQYEALHYVDYSGDGFVETKFSDGSFDFADWRKINAYSIVAPPDYFPYCDQVEIFDSLWHGGVWFGRSQALCDLRILPNIRSHRELLFKGIDRFDTCTALICKASSNGRVPSKTEQKVEQRVSYLTDAASGVFAPGWDTSFDLIPNGRDNVPHLAAYGLGSPFPEDAKLCAALSSFWPAVAPDIARSFLWRGRIGETIIPLTDDEIGSTGGLGWDGEQGPIIINDGGIELIKYKRFEYVDYTLNALENKFDYHKLANIDTQEYIDRVNRLVLAKSRVQNSEGLISFIINEGNYIFRFLTDSSVDSEDTDTVTLRINSSITVSVNENNQIHFI